VIARLLVANRGEIATRVLRTARAMGIATVAVFSDADREAPFVTEADEAVALAGIAPAEAYLRLEAILDAAERTGADAVHPGYGFLAESPELAAGCRKRGLVFVGPTPEVLAALGDKVEARRVAAAAGVPVLAGEAVTGLDGDALAAAADRVGFPLLVKAAAGGGGIGMRVVGDPAELAEAVKATRGQAAVAFGDDAVLLERWLEGPRHVEIQIVGDSHGRIVQLFERECSIQRRHQKLVEEAPSPAVDADLRRRLGEAALAVARAVGYTGAGTVEFLLEGSGEPQGGAPVDREGSGEPQGGAPVDREGSGEPQGGAPVDREGSGEPQGGAPVDREGGNRFWFLEVNARIQVEHPVTEAVTGLDLARLQLLVAAGQPLPPEATQAELRGHAIEARLYAEDPVAGFLPQAGVLRRFRVGDRGVRVDAGVADGSEVGVHYDPLLAKVIVHAPTREEAAGRLAAALAAARLHGVVTNRDLLVGVVRSEAFLAGETDTSFLDRHAPAELTAAGGSGDPSTMRLHAAAAALAAQAQRRAAATAYATIPSGWRNNPSQLQRVDLRPARGQVHGEVVSVGYRFDRAGTLAALEVDGDPLVAPRLWRCAPDPEAARTWLLDLEVDGVRRRFEVHQVGDSSYVDSPLGHTELHEVPRFPEGELWTGGEATDGVVVSPLPGVVRRVAARVGERVEAGAVVVVVEAMKTEHRIAAGRAGTIGRVLVAEGQEVAAGAVVVELEEATDG
jgi:propionyl-CoA carboxylase alpha chain